MVDHLQELLLRHTAQHVRNFQARLPFLLHDLFRNRRALFLLLDVVLDDPNPITTTCEHAATHPQIHHMFPCSGHPPLLSSYEQDPLEEERYAERGAEEARARKVPTDPQPKPSKHKLRHSPPQASNAHLATFFDVA